MGQRETIDRLRMYLRQLPPSATARLQAEYERILAQGSDPVASFVLTELRAVAAPPLAPAQNTAELVFQPVVSFLVDRGEREPVNIGQIRRSSLEPFWHWLSHDAMPEEALELDARLAEAQSGPVVEAAVRRFQLGLADTVTDMFKGTVGDQHRHRIAMRVGGPSVMEDMTSIAHVLRHRDALEQLAKKLPGSIRALADSHLTSVKMVFLSPALQDEGALPFALSQVAARLDAPWQIVRLASAMAETDDATRVASHPFGVAVELALQGIKLVVGDLRGEIRRGRFDNSAALLKMVHDALRGLRTELDIRNESRWGKQIAAIRVDISSLLESEIETVPGRVRRLLRQRPDKDIAPGTALDLSDVAETESLIDFVATCRTYANELAVNEVTSRAFSEIQNYIENATKALIDSLRAGDEKVLPFRKAQADVAIRFCGVIFGEDYAVLMKKARDVALLADSGQRAG